MRAADGLNRRLGLAVLVSLLVHGFVLSLRFGIPGLALPGPPSSISVRLADPAPAPPVPIPEAAVPGPQVSPAAPPKPAVKKDKPRQSRRISTPLPARETLETPTRVIAQDTQPNDNFVVPLPQPEEAVQQTVDPAEAQHGTDQGRDASTAAVQAEAEAAEAAREEAQAVQAEQARKLAEEQALAAAMAERQQADELAAQQKRALALAEQQKAEELVAQKRAQALAEQQKAAQLAEQQRAQELAARRQAEQLAAQQQADEAARQRAEQQAAEQREPAAAQAPAPANPGPAGAVAGPGGGGGSALVPKNLLGSDAATRARALSRGIDLLSGNPPPRPRIEDERGQRRALVGSAERDLPLRMYAESWRQKIERNGTINFPQRIGDRARIDPLVSVAIRSDGSVEDVTIVRSSGRADTDEAVRRIVRLNARYSAFPPNIAARYDVIEIRRIWTFDDVLKLIEEAH